MTKRTYSARGKLFVDFLIGKVLHRPRPLVALLFLTSRCNLNCRYCFADHQGETPDLPLAAWYQIISELRRRGTRLIILMGGEPLLYRGFDAVVSQIKSLGMECDITTNGVLIPEYAKQLENVDMLMVSLDGNEKGNDANRGRGSWKLITKGIETAKAHEIPLRINCVLTRNNVTEIEDLLDYASTVNAYVGFTIPAKCPSLDSMADQALTRDEIILVHERLLDLAKKGYKITLSEQSIKHVMKYPRPFDELVYKTDPDHKSIYPNECPYGRFIVFIDAKGSIYPCTTLWEFPSVFQPKNIFSDGFDEALRHAQDLPCWICYCAGGPEWDYFTSLKGIIHGLRFSMRV